MTIRAALALLLLSSAASADPDPLLARDATPTWRELTVVKAAAAAPFDRIEVRRQRDFSAGHGDGVYRVALRRGENWYSSEDLVVDEVPSKTCHIGAGRVEHVAITPVRVGGAPAVLVDLLVEQTLLLDCPSDPHGDEKAFVDREIAAFYADRGRGGSGNGHVFVVCGVGADRVRCTPPQSTRAEKHLLDCDLGSTLAWDRDAAVETCKTRDAPAVTTTRYAVSLAD